MSIGSALTLEYDAFHRLILTTPEGERHVGVLPVRCFPFSHPEGEVSFLDAQGHEVYFLADPRALPPKLHERLATELANREILPRITRIQSISSGAEPTTWVVETDAGEKTFDLTSEDQLKRHRKGAMITDSMGIRYRIVMLDALDKKSRRLLNRYL